VTLLVGNSKSARSGSKRVKVPEETRIAIASVRGRNCYQRVLVVLAHHDGFSLPVIVVILDNAKRVYPEVLNPEFASHMNSFGERARETLIFDSQEML